jgi:hypothetical protein
VPHSKPSPPKYSATRTSPDRSAPIVNRAKSSRAITAREYYRNLAHFVQADRLGKPFAPGVHMELAALIAVLVLAGSFIPGKSEIVYYR